MRSPFFFFLALFCSASAGSQPAGNGNDAGTTVFIPAEKTIFYRLGDKTIPIRVSQYGQLKNIVCINLHDNETTSVQAARLLLQSTGGTLIKIENNHQRIIRFKMRGHHYSFDPNRIFSRIGIEQTLTDNGRSDALAVDEITKFAERLLELVTENSSCIIALHNNTNEGFSITSYEAGNDRQYDARAVYANRERDIDDIVLTTDSLLFTKMAAQGYNAIWQDNVNAQKDGSLSVYCGERNKRYVNIETEHGKLEPYIEMLEKLLGILMEENEKSPAENY